MNHYFLQAGSFALFNLTKPRRAKCCYCKANPNTLQGLISVALNPNLLLNDRYKDEVYMQNEL
jgi:hypothetical protein